MASGLAISFSSERKVMIFSFLHELVAINKAPVIKTTGIDRGFIGIKLEVKVTIDQAMGNRRKWGKNLIPGRDSVFYF
jgi:hypothetical protein